jgi:hypothetical protein
VLDAEPNSFSHTEIDMERATAPTLCAVSDRDGKVLSIILHANYILTGVLLLLEVKSFFCLIKRHAMKTYGGVDVKLHVFLASALRCR